jgi:hypothetical protein
VKGKKAFFFEKTDMIRWQKAFAVGCGGGSMFAACRRLALPA